MADAEPDIARIAKALWERIPFWHWGKLAILWAIYVFVWFVRSQQEPELFSAPDFYIDWYFGAGLVSAILVVIS